MTMISKLMNMNQLSGSSYPSDIGGIIINMEMTAALGEIFNLNYAMEQVSVYEFAKDKGIEVPVSEGVLSNAKKALGDFWEKVKEWFAKLKEKIKEWIKNIVRGIEGFLGDHVSFVKKYDALIRSADMTEVAKSIESYTYTNVDDFPAIMQQTYQHVCVFIVTRTEDSLNRLKSLNDEDTKSALIEKRTVILSKLSALSVANLCRDLTSKIDTSLDPSSIAESETRRAYFRNGVKTNTKTHPSSINIDNQIAYVLNFETAKKDIKTLGDKIANGCDDFSKRIDVWKREFSDVKGASDALNNMMNSVGLINNVTNLMITEYVSVLKERAATAFQICRKAASLASKKKQIADH